jgi:hypothetical protein
MDEDRGLRRQLVDALGGGHAHVPFDQAVAGWKPALRGVRPEGTSHTAWQLLEHLRIAQRDILEFSRNPGHASPEWPEGYWPPRDAPPGPAAWSRSVREFENDLEAMQALVADPRTDLHARIPHGTGQTILREALTLGAHNSYHIGQLMALRRMLGI